MASSIDVGQQSIGHLIALVVAKVRSAWRFRWFGAATAWCAGLIGLGAVMTLPNVYEASARIYVDTSSVLEPILTNQIVAPDVMAQLTYVNSALVGRAHLLRVIAENKLDADAVPPPRNSSKSALRTTSNGCNRPNRRSRISSATTPIDCRVPKGAITSA